MSTFACSDVHGNFEIVEQILDFLQPDDTLYFLGDAEDRRDDGLKSMMALLQDERVTYLLGNHEDFILQYYSFVEREEWKLADKFCDFWIDNGGAPTLLALEKMDEDLRETILFLLESLPLQATYNREDGAVIEMSHSGYWGSDTLELLENRTHFLNPEVMSNHHYRVHGHTPNWYIAQRLPLSEVPRRRDGPLWYNEGHKCGIDSFVDWQTILLNLDTFESKIFF